MSDPDSNGATGHTNAHIGSAADFVTAQALQLACQRVGFHGRPAAATADAAIEALPADVAEKATKEMRGFFDAAGDRERAAWSDKKLREIQTLELGHLVLRHLVRETPRDELVATAREVGAADDLTHAFIDGLLNSAMPTVAELRVAHPELAPADADRR